MQAKRDDVLNFFQSSNRTFMELKSQLLVSGIDELLSSNRTFMELKLMFPMFCNTEETVLIVPLWN